MIVKLIEIRDRMTFIPAIAVMLRSTNHSDAYLMRRSGHADDSQSIMLTRLSGDEPAQFDIYAWGGRTWPVVHKYLYEHWDSVRSGDVVDVEFILGETAMPKRSESYDHG